ncbi:MAG TPA: neutral/alkaline non-lysosomal ceramidase N-terminal domain-containing protein [Candidatus Acidoferrales bacterium]|nr:neutral/alkaline non-lysosomal ceramidase N-terminal domain-containing protein [Candidatus Acidoferrales bacterium]
MTSSVHACVLLLSICPWMVVAGQLRAGAARVDITPAADAALPMGGYAGRTQGFRSIHDNVYVRAIVLDDGATQAALVAWESLFVPDAVWAETSQRIAAEAGIRPENLLLSAVHDHGAPILSLAETAAPKTVAYTKSVEDAAIAAVRGAKSQLQPARFGIGTGTAYVNVNRREAAPGRGLWLGYNEEGPSDKTVTVLRFDDLNGRPIAFWINYSVHAVVMGPENLQVTGDLAGATARFVEQHYLGKDHLRSDGGSRLRLRPEDRAGSDVVAVWTSGAAGDQNPVSMVNGEDFGMVDALGKILGEAVVRAAGAIKTSAEARIQGAQQVVTCPGRHVEPGPTPRAEYKFNDADPVNIRLGLVTINDVALAGVSGEVFTLIAQRLKRETPVYKTVMVTHTNGSSGYIPNDAAFEPVSYEVTASRLKPGCAEGAIVNGFLELMAAHR